MLIVRMTDGNNAMWSISFTLPLAPFHDSVGQKMKTGFGYDGQSLCQSLVHAPVPPFVFDLVFPSGETH
jgi:hypothetical protein